MIVVASAATPGEILRHGDTAKIMLAQKSLQGDGRGELSGTNQLRGDRRKIRRCILLGKMLGFEEIGDRGLRTKRRC